MKRAKRNWISLVILLFAHLLTIVDIFIINVAIPSIQEGIHSSDSDIQLVLAMYMIGFASFLIVGGKAGDSYGRKKVFLLSMFFFMLSSTGCCFAKTPEALIVMRFFQGVSAAFMSPQVLSFIQVLFIDHKERTYAIGWYGITIGIGTMLGQFLGGYLVALRPFIVEQSWQYIFLVNVPICLIGILLAKVYLIESRDSTASRMNLKGAIVLSIGAILLIYSLTIGKDLGTIHFITLLLISFCVLTAFILNQRSRLKKNKAVLLNISLFKHKGFNMAVLAVVLFMFMLDSYFLILTLFLQKGLQLLPFEASYFIVAQGFGFIVSSFFSAKLVLRFGKGVLIFGTILIISASILQLVSFHNNDVFLISYAIMIIHGSGVALVLPSLANIALKGVTENLIGNASGVYSTLQQFAGACGIALLGGMFYHMVEDPSGYNSYYHAFLYGMVANVACLIGVLLILVLLPNTILPKRKLII
jgi:EmrB/QacA subfamily drug resistance transporter